MTTVVGKWKIDTCENFEDYMKAIGVSDEKRADAHKFLSTGSDMSQEFKAEGDNWTMTTCSAGKEITVTFTTDGDSLVEKQKGDGFECTHVRKGDENSLTMTLTGVGQTCMRKFIGM